MDGGGRFLQPLTAGFPGGAGPRAGTVAPRVSPFGASGSLGGSLQAGLALIRRRLPTPRRRSVAVPLRRRLPRFLGTGLALGFYGVVVVYGLAEGGHLGDMAQRHGMPHHAIARALGLGVERVTLAGLSGLHEPEVIAAAGITPQLSLAFLDVAEVRARIEAMPLVRTASVRKLYPNELVVTLTERDPHALWQRHGELFVIAADGAVIDSLRDARFATLPLVVGEDANMRTRDYLALLEAAGPLRPRIKAGTLVAGRRWTLKMDNGIDVRLPEGDAAGALARLVRLEREQRILARDIIAVDLRLPDRVVVRLTEEAAAVRAEANKKKPARGKGVET